MDTFIVYGITDCPACLRACAELMECDREYVFVESDFSPSYRTYLKDRYTWPTFPIIIYFDGQKEELIGGYEQLRGYLAGLSGISTPSCSL